MKSRHRARFGVFELDFEAGELRKGGTRVRLQEQPFQVLKALVERPGEVVSREELQQRLWPEDTFVDFEDGLSTSVKKIRRALGDSAANPRFVETLPKRGYRFVAPVQSDEASSGGRSSGIPKIWLALVALLVVIGVAALLLLNDRGTEPKVVPRSEPLTSDPGQETTPDFSPDGSQVVYAATGDAGGGDLDLYIKLIGPGEPVRLTEDPGDDFGPAWSPDGRWIVFSRWRRSGSVAEIMVTPALGGRERKLGEYWFNPDRLWPYLAWTSDSQWIIFSDCQVDWRLGCGLSFRSLETGETVPLTTVEEHTQSGAFDILPAVSPDGEWVAYTRRASSYHIYKVRISSDPKRAGEPQRLTKSDSSAFRFGPRWAPDGSAVIYWEMGGPGADGLWRVEASGTGEARPLNINGIHPAVSASARRLAYERSERRIDIWRVALDGPGRAQGNPERWIASTYEDVWPSYSPDGEKIAFRSSRSGFDEIWVANSDGSQPTRLTALRGGQSGTPRWSPDGSRLLFNSMNAGGNRDVFIMGAEGGKIRRLTHHSASDYLPSWSADGRWVYFTSARSGHREVWKIPADGGEAVQVTKAGGSSGFESPDGAFHYFVRERALWRLDTSNGEESPVPGLAGMSTHKWTLVETGVYYSSPHTGNTIRYFDFATKKLSTVAKIEGTQTSGVSVAPDGRSLLFAQFVDRGADLMLVEDFE